MSVKIAIGLPTNRGIKPKTALSLMRLVAHSQYEYHFIISTKGYNTAENRSYIAAQAVKNGCTHLLCVDDDMIYQEDTLDKLLAHDKDIIGGLYKTKYENPDYVVEFLDERSETEPFKVGAVGSGLTLIKTDVLKKIPQPWFGYEWYENGMVKMSQDWFFCHKARELGYDIWVDPTVTAQHIGLKEF